MGCLLVLIWSLVTWLITAFVMCILAACFEIALTAKIITGVWLAIIVFKLLF